MPKFDVGLLNYPNRTIRFAHELTISRPYVKQSLCLAYSCGHRYAQDLSMLYEEEESSLDSLSDTKDGKAICISYNWRQPT